MGHITHPVGFRLGLYRSWHNKQAHSTNGIRHSDKWFFDYFDLFDDLFYDTNIIEDNLIFSHIILKYSSFGLYINIFIYDGVFELIFINQLLKLLRLGSCYGCSECGLGERDISKVKGMPRRGRYGIRRISRRRKLLNLMPVIIRKLRY